MFGAVFAILLLSGPTLDLPLSPRLAIATPASVAPCYVSSVDRAACEAQRDPQTAPDGNVYSSSRRRLFRVEMPGQQEGVTVARHFALPEDSLNAPPTLSPVAAAVVPAVVPTAQKPAIRPHAFFDRKNAIGFAVHGAIRAADATQTCMLLGKPGRRETWLPMSSCGAIVGYSIAMVPAQIGTSYIMHRKGHHTLERWLPYLWATPSAAGLAVSIRAW